LRVRSARGGAGAVAEEVRSSLAFTSAKVQILTRRGEQRTRGSVGAVAAVAEGAVAAGAEGVIETPPSSVAPCLGVCVCVRARACACVFMYIHVYTYIYIHTYMHACMYTYIHTYIHTYTHICI
jgi:hypothetical protein